jgi:predicted nuclease of predicted toxin-antitoxin system
VRFLFDENLSTRLVSLLQRDYPGCSHVEGEGLRGTPDATIWAFARENGFVIVTKDGDFRHLAIFHGAPPRVIWMRVGNLGTGAIAARLRNERSAIDRFVADPESALLVIG